MIIDTILVLDWLHHKKLTNIQALWNDGERRSDDSRNSVNGENGDMRPYSISVMWRSVYVHFDVCEEASKRTAAWICAQTFSLQSWTNLLWMFEMISPYHVVYLIEHPLNVKYHFYTFFYEPTKPINRSKPAN